MLLKPPCPASGPVNPQLCFLPVKNQSDVLARIKAAADKDSSDSLLTFFNYDPARLGPDKTPGEPCLGGFLCPNFEDGTAMKVLDSISGNHRILVASESGHIVYVNTKEYNRLNICPPPASKKKAAAACHQAGGAQAAKEEQIAQDTGQLDEDLALWAISLAEEEIVLRSGDPQKYMDGMFARAQSLYQQRGFTLIQEGAATGGDLKGYLGHVDQPQWPFVATALVYDVESPLNGPSKEIYWANEYLGKSKNLVIAGLKVFSDGSTQGLTANMYTDYLTLLAPFKPWAPYRGWPDLTVETMRTSIKAFHDNGTPLPSAIHQNGDAEINDVLDALTNNTKTGVRDLLIHLATATTVELDRAKNLGGVTFLMEDLYYYGVPMCDQVVGFDRAKRLYPAGEAASKGIRFGLHSDSPVTPPYPLFAVWVAATRSVQAIPGYKPRDARCNVTSLGGDQAISIFQGLKAFTSDAAWLYGTDNVRGTLEAGKAADLVVLSADPLDGGADNLKNIWVQSTVHAGNWFLNPLPGQPVWPN